MLRIDRQVGVVQGTYIYTIIDDVNNKELSYWYHGDKEDLHLILINNDKQKRDSNSDDFVINKRKDSKLYLLIDNIYKTIASSEYNTRDSKTDLGKTKRVLGSYHYYDSLEFFDKEKKVIRYLSEEGPLDHADELKIQQEKNYYRLEFINKPKYGIIPGIKIKTKDCRYGPFCLPFLRAYKELDAVYNELKVEERLKILRKIK